MRAYPRKTKDRAKNKDNFDAWRTMLADAKQSGVRSLLPGQERSGTRSRLVSEVRDAVLYRLREAGTRMKAVRSLLTPPAARAKSKMLEAQVTELTGSVELLYGRRKSKRP